MPSSSKQRRYLLLASIALWSLYLILYPSIPYRYTDWRNGKLVQIDFEHDWQMVIWYPCVLTERLFAWRWVMVTTGATRASRPR